MIPLVELMSSILKIVSILSLASAAGTQSHLAEDTGPGEDFEGKIEKGVWCFSEMYGGLYISSREGKEGGGVKIRVKNRETKRKKKQENRPSI